MIAKYISYIFEFNFKGGIELRTKLRHNEKTTIRNENQLEKTRNK